MLLGNGSEHASASIVIIPNLFHNNLNLPSSTEPLCEYARVYVCKFEFFEIIIVPFVRPLTIADAVTSRHCLLQIFEFRLIPRGKKIINKNSAREVAGFVSNKDDIRSAWI